MTFLMPFFAAQVPSGALICGSVIDVRAMYGDFVVMIDVAALKITIGFFAWVATSATASASGVSPNPARKSTLSWTTSSCARRLATSGDGPPVSLTMSWTFRPATVSPCSFLVRLGSRLELLAVVGEGSGERRDDADLDGLLRKRRQGDEQAGDGGRGKFVHDFPTTS